MDKNNLQGMLESGMSMNKISGVVGLSMGTVWYWVKKHGLKSTHEKIGPGWKRKRGPLAPFHCKTCGETSSENFYQAHKSSCKDCFKKSRHAYTKERRRLLIAENGGKCSRCGYDKCYRALEFHHGDPSTKDPKFNQIRSWSIDRARAEVAKCDLVCSNCHREIHDGILV